ncbi:Homeobox domain-containing protein [Caenorhabditis elegans]|uniref:Homeobox domain-containing protein n=1 Tax=Caenorhabditis elegans TaxID=6239 RepID=Q17788_CAEEL|nr:Homeobox domain-containing protein [Caenorhabditis elegans]CAA90096.2 Homeobox domain-containing protein [Caenorhabditis elegans]|eukprot:NP_496232.2 C. Elegans Homeobox [Caenorhabditis elegans]
MDTLEEYALRQERLHRIQLQSEEYPGSLIQQAISRLQMGEELPEEIFSIGESLSVSNYGQATGKMVPCKGDAISFHFGDSGKVVSISVSSSLPPDAKSIPCMTLDDIRNQVSPGQAQFLGVKHPGINPLGAQRATNSKKSSFASVLENSRNTLKSNHKLQHLPRSSDHRDDVVQISRIAALPSAQKELTTRNMKRNSDEIAEAEHTRNFNDPLEPFPIIHRKNIRLTDDQVREEYFNRQRMYPHEKNVKSKEAENNYSSEADSEDSPEVVPVQQQKRRPRQNFSNTISNELRIVQERFHGSVPKKDAEEVAESMNLDKTRVNNWFKNNRKKYIRDKNKRLQLH